MISLKVTKTHSNVMICTASIHYSRVLSYLAHFDAHIDETYCEKNRNYLNINNLCLVEFAKENNIILIKDLIFL